MRKPTRAIVGHLIIVATASCGDPANTPGTTTGGGATAGSGGSAGSSSAPLGGRMNAAAGSSATTGGSSASGAGSGGAGGGALAGRAGATDGGTGGNAGSGIAGAPGAGMPAGGSSMGGASTGGASTGGAPMGGATGTDCSFTITATKSAKIGTVGVVDFTTTLASPTSAQIVYSLDGAGADILNKGGTAPVNVAKAPDLHAFLLGLKPSSSYTFHVEATSASGTCKSPDQKLMTGTLSGAPTITRTAQNASAQAPGFIITGGGVMGNTPVIIIDADGTVVWSLAGPQTCSRARLDYAAGYMWMLNLNVGNMGGEVRYVTLDGVTSMSVSQLSKAHHDFTILPDGTIATMVWSASGTDPESDLVERAPDGTVKTAFHLGPNVYAGGPSVVGGGSSSYHANSILYHAKDDSYTIGDRNPNLFVKVSRAGAVQWQFGGNCTGAKASICMTANWTVNHGHHLLDDGTFLLFSNGEFQSSSTPSNAYEFKLTTTGTPSAMQVKQYASSTKDHSDSLGDVQRLPNGNTLITFSNTGRIEEVDKSWNLVQTLKAQSLGYAEWRPDLYGSYSRD